MKKFAPLFIFFSLFFLSLAGKAQNFDTYFVDKTLRLDFVFVGDGNSTQVVSLSELSELPQWAGKRNKLSQMELAGNACLRVLDAKTNTPLYAISFSTLYHEWASTAKAKREHKMRSFENTFLIPFPKDSICVELAFRDANGSSYTHLFRESIDPYDILIKSKGRGEITPYSLIHGGKYPHQKIHVAILAEGYTLDQMPLFRSHAATATQQILAHVPFDRYKERFNFYAVESPSLQSGVSVPHEGLWKTTAFGAHFDTFYTDRYLTTPNVRGVHDALAGIPYTHIIILANTDVYGGGGIFNAYTLTTTGHADFKPVVVHELGHSFGGLADEYYYPGDLFNETYSLHVEPWEPNITTTGFKWRAMLEKDTPIPTPLVDAPKYKIGVYEGAGYSEKGIYRPSVDCRMKTNTCSNFCPVCQRALERMIEHYTE